jgi:hypothetical protein
VAERERIRCPACGLFHPAARFGINEADEFDPAQLPEHDMTLMVIHYGGRARITSERKPLPLETARALRAMLAEVLARLDAEINSTET